MHQLPVVRVRWQPCYAVTQDRLVSAKPLQTTISHKKWSCGGLSVSGKGNDSSYEADLEEGGVCVCVWWCVCGGVCVYSTCVCVLSARFHYL